MTSERATRMAMPVAGLMIAHQVAGKAVRDATFLSAWPVSDLPAIVAATAVLVVALVPIYSRLIERYGPRMVVSVGFLVSAVAHVAEWRLASSGSWVAVAIYVHIAGISGLLLSGFWSVMSERFDVQAARRAYGRIAATGTIGGLAGGFAVARLAAMGSTTSPLLMLAVLHVACSIGVAWLGDPPAGFSSITRPTDRSGGVLGLSVLKGAPHLVTLGGIVVLGTAGATLADYLLKMQAVQHIGTGAALLEFFATFYMAVQVATFLAQFAVSANVRRFGLGSTIAALPAGTGGIGTLNLLYPAFPMAIVLRGAESVLRGSLFRSAYELIFVPMDPVEKRRAKTFLDVTCDRGGDAIGAGIVQLILLTSAAYLTSQLLAAVIALSAIGVWLSRRLDALYLGMVERRLTDNRETTPLLVPSETGWTVLDLSRVTASMASARPAIDRKQPAAVAGADPVVASLLELRSGDRQRVERALRRLTDPKAVQLAQVVQLLAWNDIVPDARAVLERACPFHAGLLTDALLDSETDFAIRRRIPRVLGTAVDQRAINGLVGGLDDGRFEVRFQCSRAIVRLRLRDPSLKVDGERLMAVAERELSVSPQVWHGYRLIDNVEHDDDTSAPEGASQGQRNLEHLFALLSGTLPAGPLDVALRGIRSEDAGLRGVAIEYLESALPQNVWENLTRLLDATPTRSGADAPGRSDPPRPASPR